MRLADRLRVALDRPAPADLLASDLPESGVAEMEAAVLMAVTERSEPGMIFTVRTEDMRTHAGQVSFPGGRIDPGETAAEAALREAWEEVGIDPSVVEIIGAVDSYRTITGFRVTPVLAAVPPDLSLVPHDREVADWFEAPLAFVLDPRNHSRESVLFEGADRHYYVINWDGRRIWGATAAMLVNLSRRLDWR